MRPEVKHQRGKTPCSPGAPGAHSQQHHPGELLNTTRVFKIAAIFHPLIDIIKKVANDANRSRAAHLATSALTVSGKRCHTTAWGCRIFETSSMPSSTSPPKKNKNLRTHVLRLPSLIFIIVQRGAGLSDAARNL